MGKKDMNEGWGTYNGKSRKSASWGDEIKGGWDLGGSSSISFSADKGSSVQQQAQVDSDLSWGGDVKRKKKGGWFDKQRDDKKNAVDNSVSWGGFSSAKNSSWSDTHDGHRDGDKKNAVDNSVSWGGFSSAKNSSWSDTHDGHREGDKKNAVDSSVSWGGSASAKNSSWSDTHDGHREGDKKNAVDSSVSWGDSKPSAISSGTNISSHTDVYYDRTLYEHALSVHKIRKTITAIVVLGFVIFMLINASFFAAFVSIFGLGVPAIIYVIMRSNVEEMYQLCFLQPYIKNMFSGTYHDSFKLNLMEPVSYFSDSEVIQAWRDFKIAAIAPNIDVSSAVVGKIDNLPVRIYSYQIGAQENSTTQSNPAVLVKLPLRGFVENSVRIRKSLGNKFASYSGGYSAFDLEIKCKKDLLNEKAKTLDELVSDDDSIDIETEDFYGKIIQSVDFLNCVSEAFKSVSGVPTLYFYDNYAYLYMEVPNRIYSEYDRGEMYKEVEKLDADTAIFLPLCKKILELSGVFGMSEREEA